MLKLLIKKETDIIDVKVVPVERCIVIIGDNIEFVSHLRVVTYKDGAIRTSPIAERNCDGHRRHTDHLIQNPFEPKYDSEVFFNCVSSVRLRYMAAKIAAATLSSPIKIKEEDHLKWLRERVENYGLKIID